jgi:hypothetical protein
MLGRCKDVRWYSLLQGTAESSLMSVHIDRHANMTSDTILRQEGAVTQIKENTFYFQHFD